MVPADQYVRHGGGHGRSTLVASELSTLLREGATLVIDAMDELHAPLAELSRNLERRLEIPVQVNVYATWSADASLGLRWDDHEVIVIQIAGQRRWELFGQTMVAPTAQSRPTDPTGSPAWRHVVETGDVLYLPRGCWQATDSGSEPTIHLAISFRNPTGLDVASYILSNCYLSEVLRMDYPRFCDPETQGRYLTAMQRAIGAACAEPGLLLRYLRDLHRKAAPRNSFGLPWSASREAVPPFEDFVIVPQMRFYGLSAIEQLEDETAIEVQNDGTRLRFRREAARMLEYLLRNAPLSMSEFVSKYHGDATSEERRTFVSDLAKQGIVVFRTATDSYRSSEYGGNVAAAASFPEV
jgi:hypothetical protein